ncbi:MAG TPA: hypothetical protein VNZ61_19460 [Roseomonas sp.]|nr:hypothetical protein [Roseomonas sp.]
MRYSECGGTEADLDYAMGVAERRFEGESAGARFVTLCLMAAIVARYPPGPWQEEAEDRLSARMGGLPLTPAELALLRRFRAGGLEEMEHEGRRRRAPAPRRAA